MLKATKLPSGNYRVRVEIGKDETGKRIWKSFTGEDKKLVVLEAAKFKVEHRESKSLEQASFRQKAEEFIRDRSVVLSPATTRAYQSYLRVLARDYKWFCEKRVYLIVTSDLQVVVDGLVTSGSSAKTIRNYYGFITVVLNNCGVMVKSPKMPQKERPQYNIPDEPTVKKILKCAAGTDLEIPIMLAAFAPMRRGEICALTMNDIKGNVIHVCKDIVRDSEGNWVTKPPKTFSSDRFIEMPQFVIDRIHEVGHITKDGQTPDGLSKAFKKFLARNGFEYYRFHDLRHFCCSHLHAIGVPDIYIMQRSGHATTTVLREVYTHTLQSQSKEETKKILSSFEAIRQ